LWLKSSGHWINQQISNSKPTTTNAYHERIKPKEYFLVTAHRAENVDNPEKLGEILKGLRLVGREFSLPVIFPMHPRTRKMAAEFRFEFDGIRAIEPLGFLEFLQLEAGARLALTDSGGGREETCIPGSLV
jgi:UDP-N-acetylglucosamine 2-epimerase (non-hydrolysing)